ncbi:MAG: T9SS type A sorting domain-containing protein [Bacteroidetes bacterium]|nr:T9SS type A sorting domain-containing protein [Bacteroidota bacterium]
MGQSSRVYSITVLPPNNPYCISLSSNINIDDRSVLVFPNPAESFLQINFDRNNSLTGIDIYDPEGRKIKSSTTHYNDNQQYYIGDLKSGVYTLNYIR